jgi:hypothetical protein
MTFMKIGVLSARCPQNCTVYWWFSWKSECSQPEVYKNVLCNDDFYENRSTVSQMSTKMYRAMKSFMKIWLLTALFLLSARVFHIASSGHTRCKTSALDAAGRLWVSQKSAHLRTFFPDERKWNYTCVCTVNLYAVLKVKNALVLRHGIHRLQSCL